ncbi:ABC transporter permease [Lachnospiraceae bacterium]|nr:ABC transporter permease [Lachnospiraceae bacterium]
MQNKIQRMSLWRRIEIRIKRERKKAIVLTAAFFTLSLLILIGVVLETSVNNSLKELREQFFACLTIERTLDEESVVSTKLAEDVVSAVKPKGWTGKNVYYLSMENISLIPGLFAPQGDEDALIAKFISCGDSRFVREFTNENFYLKEGRHLTREDEKKAIISDALAEYNGLSLGDKISSVVTDNLLISAKQGIGTRYEYEIVGIFTLKDSETDTRQRAECEMLENCLFVDEQSGLQFLEDIRLSERQYTNGITIWVPDPAELPDLYDQMISLPDYNWEDFFINTNAEEYKQSAEPMMRMEQIVLIFMLIIIVISVLILIVLLTMWNHERIHEMAILLSIGCTKTNLFTQLFLENELLFSIGYIIAALAVQFSCHIIKSFTTIGEIRLAINILLLAGVAGTILTGLITAASLIKMFRKPPRELLTIQQI